MSVLLRRCQHCAAAAYLPDVNIIEAVKISQEAAADVYAITASDLGPWSVTPEG